MAHAPGTSLRTDTHEHLSIEEVEAREKDRRARHQSHDRIAAVLYPVATMVGVIVLWEVGVRAFGVPSFLAPPPSQVVATIIEHGNLVLKNTWVTTVEIMLGYLTSIVIGVPLAFGIFMWPSFSRTVLPLLISSQAIPKVAIAPLLLVWFGFGLLPKVLVAFLIAFFPIVISTAVGLASIEPEKIYLARSMGLGATATFFKIRLPNALPSIFAGLKISITLAVVGAVVGEFVGGEAGLGYMLMVANGSMDTPLLFAGLIALTIQGVVLYA
ncbi:MAG TPA: ABC transporter permease, partial [Xanthobacteraceae bacterium]|nr:ABC transporter permease [Xanthobacteraceae bacterium]